MTALGIDVGTTTVKVCVTSDCNKIASNSLEHDAQICFGEKGNENLSSRSFYEQDVAAIITTLDKCLCKIRAHLNHVKKIAVTGQMHGVLLWKKRHNEKKEMYESFSDCFNKTVQKFSNLITWEDKRCSQDFFKTLPASLANCNLHSGFGFASLIWLQQHSNDLSQYDCCGTIMDFVVWLFTQTEHVYMTSHNANSWGYYDIREKSWETEVLKATNIYNSFQLPCIVEQNRVVGLLKCVCHGLNNNVEVYPAYGDMQCSIAAAKANWNEAVLSLGTSAQLSVIVDAGNIDTNVLTANFPALSVVPYTKEKHVVTAASLNGGNVFRSFLSFIHSILQLFGCSEGFSYQDIAKVMENQAHLYMCSNSNNAQQRKQSIDRQNHELKFIATLFGERFDPNKTASLSNINQHNSSLGHITLALYKGILHNLFDMMPLRLIRKHNVDTIVGTGGMILNSSLVKDLIGQVSNLNTRFISNNDAAFGAILFCQGKVY